MCSDCYLVYAAFLGKNHQLLLHILGGSNIVVTGNNIKTFLHHGSNHIGLLWRKKTKNPEAVKSILFFSRGEKSRLGHHANIFVAVNSSQLAVMVVGLQVSTAATVQLSYYIIPPAGPEKILTQKYVSRRGKRFRN